MAAAAQNALGSALNYAKGVIHPSPNLKASLRPISDVDLPRSEHSLTVLKGRAYIFGGLIQTSPPKSADNDTHIVILPSSGIEGSDYRRIEATAEAPSPRSGHSAAAIDDQIYIFGGKDSDGNLLDEQGRIWVFDTRSNRWSHLDPPSTNKTRPSPRIHHAAVATEHPRPVRPRTDAGSLPQAPPDPAAIVPEPPTPTTYGTIIISGGAGPNLHAPVADDTWAFDLSTRSWASLPDPPPVSSPTSSLALVGSRLYSLRSGSMTFLDFSAGSHDDASGIGELGLTPLGPWAPLLTPAHSSTVAPLGPGVLIPATTGQGRNWLLFASGDALKALQLKPEGMTAASVTDAARMALKRDTHEAEWRDVEVAGTPVSLLRTGAAVTRGSEVEGASLLIWGGEAVKGGVMVSVVR